MNREPDPDGGSGLGEGADQFDAIVAGWRDEGDVPRWPDDGDAGDGVGDAEPESAVAAAGPVEAPAEPPDPAELDEHFVPPEPPPLPRIGPPIAVGLILIVVGIVLIVAPSLIGVPELYGTPLGLVGIAAGLGWLVLRLWPEYSGDDRDEDDDGAVL